MGIKLNTTLFIDKSNEIHNNKYDYCESVYINTTTKVKIKCKLHGLFEQLPTTHLKGKGCIKCGRISSSLKKIITKESFFEKVNIIYNNKYSYPDFEPSKTSEKINIICPDHGIFRTTINSHIYNKTGCPKCGNNKKGKHIFLSCLDNFIEKSNKVHNNKYNYSLVIYENYNSKIKIICPKKHIFEQTPSNHLRGNGCNICKNTDNIHRKSGFVKIAKDKLCTFYVLKCFNEEEEFYKIRNYL